MLTKKCKFDIMNLQEDDMKIEVNRKLGVCLRCKNEKQIDKNGICRDCNEKIDLEYANLYTFKSME